MHPRLRQSSRDRMIAAYGDLKWPADAVTARASGRWVGGELAVLVVPHRTGVFVSSAPATDADHVVERFPSGKRVVRGVYGDEPYAFFHVLLERRLDVRRPSLVGRIVVEHDNLVSREGRVERAEVAAGGRRRHDVNLKQSGLIELLLQDGRHHLPPVVWAGAFPI